MRLLALAVAAALGGCNLGDPVGLFDASGDAAAEEEQALDVGRLDVDDGGGDAGPLTGPLTLVTRRLTVSTDRICDLDGDGVEDNAVADLGAPGAGLITGVIDTALAGAVERGNRWLFHFPLVDDLRTPDDRDTFWISASGHPADPEPDDYSDDFSGEEPFFARGSTLDACGEPVAYSTEARIVEGHLDSSASSIFMSLGDDNPIIVRRALAFGEIDPGGVEARIDLCGAALIHDLGDVTTNVGGEGLSALELLVGGGAALGAPAIPGVEPDVDVDGDGLEGFELDAEGHILRCLDGDGSIIEGEDCWRDPRMADGVGIAMRAEAVGAVFAGPQPSWRIDNEGTCGHARECMETCDPSSPCDQCSSRLCEQVRDTLADYERCFAERCAASSCEGAHCAGDCSSGQADDCRRCLAVECAAEVDACDMADCCDEPPETSRWDPR